MAVVVIIEEDDDGDAVVVDVVAAADGSREVLIIRGFVGTWTCWSEAELMPGPPGDGRGKFFVAHLFLSVEFDCGAIDLSNLTRFSFKLVAILLLSLVSVLSVPLQSLDCLDLSRFTLAVLELIMNSFLIGSRIFLIPK